MPAAAALVLVVLAGIWGASLLSNYNDDLAARSSPNDYESAVFVRNSYSLDDTPLVNIPHGYQIDAVWKVARDPDSGLYSIVDSRGNRFTDVEFDAIRGHHGHGTISASDEFIHGQIFGFRNNDTFEYWFSLTARGLELTHFFVNVPLYNIHWGEDAIGRITMTLPPERLSVGDLYAELALKALDDLVVRSFGMDRTLQLVNNIEVSETADGLRFALLSHWDDILGFVNIVIDYASDSQGQWQLTRFTFPDDYTLNPTPTKLDDGDRIGDWRVIFDSEWSDWDITYRIGRLATDGGVSELFIDTRFTEVTALNNDGNPQFIGICYSTSLAYYFEDNGGTLELMFVKFVYYDPPIYMYVSPEDVNTDPYLVREWRDSALALAWHIPTVSDIGYIVEIYVRQTDGRVVFEVNASEGPAGYRIKITEFKVMQDADGKWSSTPALEFPIHGFCHCGNAIEQLCDCWCGERAGSPCTRCQERCSLCCGCRECMGPEVDISSRDAFLSSVSDYYTMQWIGETTSDGGYARITTNMEHFAEFVDFYLSLNNRVGIQNGHQDGTIDMTVRGHGRVGARFVVFTTRSGHYLEFHAGRNETTINGTHRLTPEQFEWFTQWATPVIYP
jgi:hypothetical protein